MIRPPETRLTARDANERVPISDEELPHKTVGRNRAGPGSRCVSCAVLHPERLSWLVVAAGRGRFHLHELDALDNEDALAHAIAFAWSIVREPEQNRTVYGDRPTLIVNPDA